MCGLGLEQLMAAEQLLVEVKETQNPQTYWQWCSWSFPCQIRYRYSPRSCCPWVSHRFLPQCRTAGWSYRSTFPPLQPGKTMEKVCVSWKGRESWSWTDVGNDAKDAVLLWTIHRLTFGFAFAFDASDSMARTDQNAAQIWPFPLVINTIEVAIL